MRALHKQRLPRAIIVSLTVKPNEALFGLMLTQICRLLALAFVAVSFAGTVSAHSVVGSPDVAISVDSAVYDETIATTAEAELTVDHDCDGSSHSGHPCCPDTHAHCCAASPALLDRDTGLDLAPATRRAWGGFEAALPSGLRVHPPHRPPRLAA